MKPKKTKPALALAGQSPYSAAPKTLVTPRPAKLLPASKSASKPAPKLASKSASNLAAEFTFPAVLAASPKPSSTRERILYAAVEILNAEGFSSLTQTRVAKKAGVRQSHITYYFRARNDLLLETAAYACNAMLEALSVSIESGVLTLKNFRAMLVADIHDRRFSRLMCALISASDEDDKIKSWLANFEEVNRARLLENFQHLGLSTTLADTEFFHSAYVGAVMLDLAESTPVSLARAQRIIQQAFDFVVHQSNVRGTKKIATRRHINSVIHQPIEPAKKRKTKKVSA